MKAKWQKLAGELLDRAADEFSKHVCNDLSFPADWTAAEKLEFATAMAKWNLSAVADSPEKSSELAEEIELFFNSPGDCLAMRFLADALRRGYEIQNPR